MKVIALLKMYAFLIALKAIKAQKNPQNYNR